MLQPSHNFEPSFFTGKSLSFRILSYLLLIHWLFRRVIKSEVVLKVCLLSTCLKNVNLSVPKYNTEKNFALSENSMLRIDARCYVRLPPKVTLKNYSSVGPFVVRKKNVIWYNERERSEELSNFEIRWCTKTWIICHCQNYDA